jgi:hypothetical protein
MTGICLVMSILILPIGERCWAPFFLPTKVANAVARFHGWTLVRVRGNTSDVTCEKVAGLGMWGMGNGEWGMGKVQTSQIGPTRHSTDRRHEKQTKQGKTLQMRHNPTPNTQHPKPLTIEAPLNLHNTSHLVKAADAGILRACEFQTIFVTRGSGLYTSAHTPPHG